LAARCAAIVREKTLLPLYFLWNARKREFIIRGGKKKKEKKITKIFSFSTFGVDRQRVFVRLVCCSKERVSAESCASSVVPIFLLFTFLFCLLYNSKFFFSGLQLKRIYSKFTSKVILNIQTGVRQQLFFLSF